MRRVIVVTILLGGITLLLIPAPALVIEDVKGGRRLLVAPFPWWETFEICYTHSVDRKPVCEVFKASFRKGIVLRETYFHMFGAGMGHWEGHGRVLSEEGWVKIKEIDEPVGKFLLRVGSRGVDHILTIRGRKINLTEMAEGRLVEVRIEKQPWIFFTTAGLRGAHER